MALPTSESHLRFAANIIASLHDGVIVVDRDLIIREFNPAAERLMGRRASDRIGQRAEVISTDDSPIFHVLNTGEPAYNVRQTLRDGRVFEINFVPLIEDGEVVGVIQTFRDVTEQIALERRLTEALAELDAAFALTLPNTRIERKLKQTPEFRDRFNPATGKIEITEVIPDGTYRHVVNCLKVAAELHRQGAMDLVGINKDMIVQTAIFHDVGKVQPELKAGDVVNPAEVFEESKLHADRSADIAARWYDVEPDVVHLIRYHHHREDELPPDFPGHLRPMLRLFQLIDGLSACLTRRDGLIRTDVQGTRVIVDEYNPHPRYSRKWSLDLYTGEYRVLGQNPLAMPEVRVIGDRDRYAQALRELSGGAQARRGTRKRRVG